MTVTSTTTGKRRVYYDTEFLEDGRTIELISIGMVDDEGGRYYAVNELAPWERIAAEPWLMENVVPSLPRLPTGAELDPEAYRANACGVDLDAPEMRLPGRIATEVLDFIVGDGTRPAELWAWFGAFDHVRLSWLWGRMIDHPDGVPMFTCDLRQWQAQLGDPYLPDQPAGEHNALADARYNAHRWHLLAGYAGLNPAARGVSLGNATGVQFGHNNVQSNTFS